MFQVYLLIFWIPTIASLLMLLSVRRTGVITRFGLLVLWYFVALVLQVIGQLFSPAWTVGLVLQVLLAVYILIRFKLG